jgi:CRP-like cAMP-binding protein
MPDHREGERVAAPVTHTLVKTLRAVQDFASLDDATLLEIVGSSACLFWSAKSRVFTKGDPAEALYVVLTGKVRIFEEDDEVAEIPPGDYFGEHSLLLHTTHSKSAETVEESELMVIPETAFVPILMQNPDLASQMRRRLESRLVDRHRG